MADEQSVPESAPPISWVEFLQNFPPGMPVRVIGTMYSRSSTLLIPDLQLDCSGPNCNGKMFFTSDDRGPDLTPAIPEYLFLAYHCKHCGKSQKVFAIFLNPINVGNGECDAFKFGEFPPFGPPLPSRVLRLIQPDYELFLRGRRCENQGLGIGAFTYYRRVVVNQWTRLIDEILKVANTIGAPKEMTDFLSESKDQTQFSKAVKGVKEAIPPSLLIDGHNPLVLLHGALSQGVHNLPDEECLTLATSIRLVLVELVEKISQALKDEKELHEAVNRILKAKPNPKSS